MTEIGQLNNITELLLASNQLSELPEPMAQLTRLKYIDLSHNALKELPPSLCAKLQFTKTITLIPDKPMTIDDSLETEEVAIEENPSLRVLLLAHNAIAKVPDHISNLQVRPM